MDFPDGNNTWQKPDDKSQKLIEKFETNYQWKQLIVRLPGARTEKKG
jgi:hypothetical protein